MHVNSEPHPKRRIDAVGGLMVVVTLIALGGTAWMRFGRPSGADESSAASVGAQAPPLRLMDLDTREPITLVGLSSKVVWVVFWSAGAPSARTCLAELNTATKRLRSHRRFAIVTAVAETDTPAAVREMREPDLPVYLAAPETRRRFRAEVADPPLHILIDAGGKVLAMARGDGRPTIDRIATVARRRLDEIDPAGETRFASWDHR